MGLHVGQRIYPKWANPWAYGRLGPKMGLQIDLQWAITCYKWPQLARDGPHVGQTLTRIKFEGILDLMMGLTMHLIAGLNHGPIFGLDPHIGPFWTNVGPK